MTDAEGGGRERLRAALLDLCYERGYPQLTLPLLLERAGVGEGEFHRHFTDLEDCFYRFYLEMQDELLEQIRVAVDGLPSWRDRLRTTAYTMLAYLAEDERRARFTVLEVHRAGERLQQAMVEFFTFTFDLLDAGREEHADPDHFSRATAQAIGGAVFLQMRGAFEQGSVQAVRARIPAMMHAAVLPYLGPEAAAAELRIEPPPLDRRSA